MRTLKKTLSLLLAVALVLSLTVVGASAAYTGNKVDTLKDAADVGADYSEAVGVMVGLGIIEGYDDGTLRPETTYTREQAAKIIAYMQLGPKDADSLRCTKAPFTDVAADRWSAGYIAYCVEQGIIDGMGDGTFQPEAQLTGYQWAKMLLCAVGYGRNDEYVGSSWSLNTAKDALDKGIFEGDLVGADHTPLQRQQAILYAFNALTSVGVVVYSPSLGDYILAYGNFADRATIEGTLGEKVYKLDVDTGIIVDNEAMGAAKTVLSVQGEYAADATAKGDDADVSVAANTGLDMMYHAAKIWHVNGTAVFVIDLAKVETLACGEMSGIAKLEKGKTVTDKNIGDTSKTKYEYYFIDNTAINANYAGVTVWASLEALGTRSETKKTTVIGNYKAVSNDYIKTDISEINKRDNVVVIKAGEKAYHVFALGATSGSVKSVNSKGVVTLSDDTVIAPSALATMNAAQVRELIEALASPAHSAPVFSFVLDTHGDYIALTNNPYRTVAYYTGAVKLSSAHDAWSSDVTWLAQFVDVATGEVEEIPVRNSWAIANGIMGAIAGQGKYFDITDELYGDETYAPEEVPVEKLYGTSYVLTKPGFNNATTFPNKDNRVDVTFTDPAYDNVTYKGGILYNNANVQFIIASYQGDKLVVDEYTGVEALVAAYAEKHNTPVSTVTLENIAMVVTRSDAGNYYATTIFAYDGALNVTGGTIFFPTGSDGAGWVVSDDYFSYEYAYINGELVDGNIRFPVPTRNYERGFYQYVIDDATSYYWLTKITTNYVQFGPNAMEGDGTGYYLEGNPLADGVKITDTRAGAGTEVDTIDELEDLVSTNYTDAWEKKVDVAYHVNAAGQVDLIYVVDNEFGSAKVTVDEDQQNEWKLVDTGNFYIHHTMQFIEDCIAYSDDSKITLNYTGAAKLADEGTLDVAYSLWDDVNDQWVAQKDLVGTIDVVTVGDKTYQNVVVDLKDIIPDNADRDIIKITGVTYHVAVKNGSDVDGSYLRISNDYTNRGQSFTVYDQPLTNDTFKVVLDELDIEVGTVVDIANIGTDIVAEDDQITMELVDADAIQNIDVTIGAVTFDSVLKINHPGIDQDYWSFNPDRAQQSNEITLAATLGKPTPVTIYRTQRGNFDANDTAIFTAYDDKIESSQLTAVGDDVYVCTFEVEPNNNLETIVMPQEPTDHGTQA